MDKHMRVFIKTDAIRLINRLIDNGLWFEVQPVSLSMVEVTVKYEGNGILQLFKAS